MSMSMMTLWMIYIYISVYDAHHLYHLTQSMRYAIFYLPHEWFIEVFKRDQTLFALKNAKMKYEIKLSQIGTVTFSLSWI